MDDRRHHAADHHHHLRTWTSRPRTTSATFVFTTEPDATFLCSLDGAEPQARAPRRKVYPRAVPRPAHLRGRGIQPGDARRIRPADRAVFDPVPAVYEWTIIDTVRARHDISYGPASHDGEPRTPTSASAPTTRSRSSSASLDGAGFSECDPPLEFDRPARSARTPSPSARSTWPATSTRRPAEYAWTIGGRGDTTRRSARTSSSSSRCPVAPAPRR